MVDFKGIFKIKKNKATEIELVNQYKVALSTLFDTVKFEKDKFGKRNSFYYSDAITNFSNYINTEFQLNNALKPLKEIEYFNRITIDLLKDIVQFFIAIDNYDSQDKEVIDDIILYKTNIEDGFKNLGQFDLKIKEFFTKTDSSIAMEEYCLNVIKEAFYFLNKSFYISIEKCSFSSDYENLIYYLEHSINKENLQFSPVLVPISKKRNYIFNESNFIDFIKNVNDKVAFAEELKNTFNTEFGIDFKIMIELLKEQNIFIIGDRKFKLFYEYILLYFERKIGVYSTLNDKYKHEESDKKAHHIKIKIIKEKLQPLIDKYIIKKVV